MKRIGSSVRNDLEAREGDMFGSRKTLRAMVSCLALLSFFWVGCASDDGGEVNVCKVEDYPCPCLENPDPAFIYGDFSLGIEDWPNGSDIPVWYPPQGGIVTGFNLVVTGTPKRASRILTTIVDAEDGTLLVDDSIRKVKLLCQENGVRLLPQFMVAFEWQYKMEDIIGRNAIIQIDLIFNQDEPEEFTITATHEGLLVDEEP